MEFDPDEVIETLGAATDENKLSSLRDQQIINLPNEGEVWLAGDLHDHRNNFKKIVSAADLGNNPQRHLVLQELIHGDHYDANGCEGSWETLYKAALLKCDFPQQLHFIFANHDLAQIHGEGIMKGGLSVCEAFTKGVKRDFGDRRATMNITITEFLLSFPLGVRCPNGLFFCHSMPADDQLEKFDFTIFERPLEGPDYLRRKGPVYQLIWGRNFSAATAEKFADQLEAKIVVTGHQPQETGYLVNGPRHLIIASDHNQGVFLPVDLSREYTMDDLVESLQKFVAVELPEEA